MYAENMAKTTAFGDMAANPKNPRKITQKQLADLKRSLEEFGDLGGIVVNRDNTLISGHQRFEAMKAANGVRIEDSEILGLPTATGTIERAWVVMPSGERFSWRRVDFSPEKAQLAMLAANKMGGDWNVPLLADNLKELHFAGADLELTGFDAAERAALFNEVPEWKQESSDEPVATAHVTVCPSCGHEWSGK